MTRIKICGVQQPDHAIAAAEAGADFIGLVFVPNRRRRLTADAAQAVVARLRSDVGEHPRVVGLFADQPAVEVVTIIRNCGLDLVQLCGNESLEFCSQVQTNARAQVIKVLCVPGPGQVDVTGLAESIQRFRDAGHLVTLDRQVDGLQGGTGQSFDWDIAAQLFRQGHSFLLAGGLTPDNVAQAVATVQPWGVDVSSGVETGGVKDPDKIRAFIKNAKYPVP